MTHPERDRVRHSPGPAAEAGGPAARLRPGGVAALALAASVVVAALVVTTAGTAVIGGTPSNARHPLQARSVAATARTLGGARTATGPTPARPFTHRARARLVATLLSELPGHQRSPNRGHPLQTADLAAVVNAPGMPTCAPPPVPAPTFPPGNGYGVPFLAAITNGQVLAGYDEWTANHLVWTAKGRTFNLFPWQSKIYDITGWVTGLLQLPTLSADIAPNDVVFCDDQGSSACLTADWPTGQCIHIVAQYGPSPASPTPPSAIGNAHPEGTACLGYATPTFSCFPYGVQLTPVGDTTLSVTGVEPNGSLDLEVNTAAATTVYEYPPPPSPTFSCQDAPARITLSTQPPTGLPATAPIAPTGGYTDYRPLQAAVQGLNGPLATATSVVGSNDFAVPAFFPSASGSPCSIFLATSLNTYAGGWDDSFQDQSTGLYYINGGTNPTVAPPGWAQISATTTVVTLGLPVGPPPGFKF